MNVEERAKLILQEAMRVCQGSRYLPVCVDIIGSGARQELAVSITSDGGAPAEGEEYRRIVVALERIDGVNRVLLEIARVRDGRKD
ncbi:MAG: hypothetical protein HYR72_27035 [Deltaproteobacteria bacterium]|nr:hypothetical protein [Deltaproteobacteria bacterium]MBI3390330.1 hypothetical protein [Deltaproteobacteria bacterium]